MSVLVETKASKAALYAAEDRECDMNNADEDSMRRLQYAHVKNRDPLMVEDQYEDANLEARLFKLRAEYRRLGIVSDHSGHDPVHDEDSKPDRKTAIFYMQSSQGLEMIGAPGMLGNRSSPCADFSTNEIRDSPRESCDLQSSVAKVTVSMSLLE